MNLNHGAHSLMPDSKKTNEHDPAGRRMALTVRLTLDAYDAIVQLQRIHRVEKGRALPMWKVIDLAVIEYAKAKGIKIRL